MVIVIQIMLMMIVPHTVLLRVGFRARQIRKYRIGILDRQTDTPYKISAE